MEVLITISLCVSAVIAWRLPGFWIPLWASATTSFVVWFEVASIATHPLVSWQYGFILMSLAISCGCFLVVWCGKWMLLRYVPEHVDHG